MMRKAVVLSLFFAPLVAFSAQAAGDPVLGKRQFAPCTSCHTLAKGEPDKVGPNLHGVMGSKAGTRGAFNYSDALKKSGIVWDEAKLDEYIKKPSAFIPGNKMAFVGVVKDDVRANIVAYVKEATK